MTGRTIRSDLGVLVERGRRLIFHDIWQIESRRRSAADSLLRLLQFGVMVGERFVHDRLLLRASALAFITALSAMPLMVVVVALIGLMGGQKSLVDFAVNAMTAVSPEANRWIISRIQEVHIGSLGAVGGTTLFFSAILALRHLESTLGDIWGVGQSRSWPRRFVHYLGLLVVGPMLAGFAVSLWASLGNESAALWLRSLPLVGWLHAPHFVQLPPILMWAAFSFLYWFFPNTRVNVRSALLGGLVAMLLFTITKVVYVGLGVGMARYSVLFGGLVALPLVLTWLYVCWVVALFGAEIAFAHQHIADYREGLRLKPTGPAERKLLALRLIGAIGADFEAGQRPKSAEELSGLLEAPLPGLREILGRLEAAEILVLTEIEGGGRGYRPASPPSQTSLADLLRDLDRVGESPTAAGIASEAGSQVAGLREVPSPDGPDAVDPSDLSGGSRPA